MGETLTSPEVGKTALEREFSVENLKVYSEACVGVATRLGTFLERDPRELRNFAVLLPSRGAIPIFIGACLALKDLGLLGRIDLPPLTCFDFIRKREEASSSENPKVPILIFPFTADVNLKSLVEDSEADRVIDGMRQFGAKVVGEFFKPPDKRNGLEYRLFLAFLETVEKRMGMVDFYKRFPQVDNLVMIDTVVSGRAS